MDRNVRRAIEAAQALHPDGEWERLTPGQRTAEIYREMRRIDEEEKGQAANRNARPK
jgi:hypothetical protein